MLYDMATTQPVSNKNKTNAFTHTHTHICMPTNNSYCETKSVEYSKKKKTYFFLFVLSKAQTLPMICFICPTISLVECLPINIHSNLCVYLIYICVGGKCVLHTYMLSLCVVSLSSLSLFLVCKHHNSDDDDDDDDDEEIEGASVFLLI